MRRALVLCLALAACGGEESSPPAEPPPVAPRLTWYWEGDQVVCLDATLREEVSPNGVPLAVFCHWHRCATTEVWNAARQEWEERVVRYSGLRFQYHDDQGAWAPCPEDVQEHEPISGECDGYEFAAPVVGPVTTRACYEARAACALSPATCTWPWGQPPPAPAQ